MLHCLVEETDIVSKRKANERCVVVACCLQDPEGRLGELKPILELLGDKDPQVGGEGERR